MKVPTERIQLFRPYANEEGHWEDSQFVPDYSTHIYIDRNCEFYRGSYLQRRLWISPSSIRNFLDREVWIGEYKSGEFWVDRTSVLESLDDQHYTLRQNEQEPIATISGEHPEHGSLVDYPLTKHLEKHVFVPELWNIDAVVGYLEQLLVGWEIENESFRRSLIRYSVEKGAFAFYRVGGSFRYKREDWKESVLRIARMEPEVAMKRGRPQQAIFYMVAPYLAFFLDRGDEEMQALREHIKSVRMKQMINEGQKKSVEFIGKQTDTLASLTLKILDRSPSVKQMIDTITQDWEEDALT